jgi:hypothetical protein
MGNHRHNAKYQSRTVEFAGGASARHGRRQQQHRGRDWGWGAVLQGKGRAIRRSKRQVTMMTQLPAAASFDRSTMGKANASTPQ